MGMPAKRPTPRPSKPRKPAVKLCPAGHKQVRGWKHGDQCPVCRRESDRMLAHKAPLPPLGPTPEVLTIRVVSTGRLIVHAIPRWLQRRRRPKRRGI